MTNWKAGMAAFFCVCTVYGLDALPKDAVPAPAAVFNFDRDALGKAPQRFMFAVTGEGPDIHWEVKRDPGAPSVPNVLVQNGKAKSGANFAMALLENVRLAHGEVSVKFKTLGGEEDQAMGIVYRYTDPKNYYVIQASSKGDSCELYRIKKGQHKLLDSKAVIISPYTWHELRITFVDRNYTAFVDGEAILGGKDKSFLDAGLIGIWTPSDSVIAFDDLRVSQ